MIEFTPKLKILVYAVSDFSIFTNECIKLLYKSLTQNNSNFDFCIISNKKTPVNFPFNTIVDNSGIINKDTFVGYLKYSPLIPKKYDIYIYLDADILYFGKLEWLYTKNSQISLVREGESMLHPWFNYPYYENSDKDILESTMGINSGSFTYRSTKLLDDINKLIPNIIEIKTNNVEHAMYEQGAFNYAILKHSNYNLNKYYDFTHMVQLRAQNSQPSKDKFLYHFCGYTNEMRSKYFQMKDFYKQYQQLLNS